MMVRRVVKSKIRKPIKEVVYLITSSSWNVVGTKKEELKTTLIFLGWLTLRIDCSWRYRRKHLPV